MQRIIKMLLDAADLALEAPWSRPRRLAAVTVLLVALIALPTYMAWIEARYRPLLDRVTSSVLESINDAAPTQPPGRTPTVTGQPHD